MLVKYFYLFRHEAKLRFFMIAFVFDGNNGGDRIADKNGAGKTEAFISIGHGHFIDHFGGEADTDRKDQRAVCDPFFKWLCFAPFFIHVMREEIARLTGMQYNIGFGHGPAFGSPCAVQFKLFEVFLNKHGQLIMDDFPGGADCLAIMLSGKYALAEWLSGQR